MIPIKITAPQTNAIAAAKYLYTTAAMQIEFSQHQEIITSFGCIIQLHSLTTKCVCYTFSYFYLKITLFLENDEKMYSKGANTFRFTIS